MLFVNIPSTTHELHIINRTHGNYMEKPSRTRVKVVPTPNSIAGHWKYGGAGGG